MEILNHPLRRLQIVSSERDRLDGLIRHFPSTLLSSRAGHPRLGEKWGVSGSPCLGRGKSTGERGTEKNRNNTVQIRAWAVLTSKLVYDLKSS